ncbi:MAG: MMPL family transporter, partial [Pseudomonadota bacterium]
LAIAGTIAILADVAGVATIYFIPIQTIQEMSLNAVFGMLAIIITNKVLMPVWLSYVKLGDIEAFKAAQKKRDDMGDGLWKVLTKITHRGPAWTILLVCAVLSGWALWMYPKLQVGDALVGVPELRPESRYNEDSRRVVANYAIGVDILKIIAEGVPDGCVDYALMEEVDRFSWRMENTAGVSSVMSLLTYARLVNSGLNEGRLNAELVPRNRDALVAATSLVPTNTGLLNDSCDALALFIFTTDHRAATIEHLFAEIKKFNEENKAAGGQVTFALASGNVGVMGASNEVVKDQEIKVVGWVYAIIILFIVLAYRTFSAVVCIIVPLGIVSLLGYAFMAILDIGMKVSTLPVVALAVGIGVDYGIYIYSMIADGIRRGMELEDAYLDTLRRTGKSVIFIGVALGSTVATWIFSKLQFQVDMGILLVFLFTANMIGAIVILPALAHFFAGEEKKHIGKPTLIGH